MHLDEQLCRSIDDLFAFAFGGEAPENFVSFELGWRDKDFNGQILGIDLWLLFILLLFPTVYR